MTDALLVRAVNSFETIGVVVVLLSTRGCCNQEDQCVFQRWLYGFFVPDVRSVVRAVSNTTRGPFAQPQLQLGAKGRFRKGAAPATKGTVHRRRRLFEQRASTRSD